MQPDELIDNMLDAVNEYIADPAAEIVSALSDDEAIDVLSFIARFHDLPLDSETQHAASDYRAAHKLRG